MATRQRARVAGWSHRSLLELGEVSEWVERDAGFQLWSLGDSNP